jgi:succinate-semialdehyde dehydrogenase/glutarate-semialdehyde dehydrogenase
VELPDQPGGAQGSRAALSTGCSIIVKAAEETPASPAELIRAFVDAGVPAGVLGLVYGTPAEISSYLIPHPVIRKITFTGSTPVGKQLAAMAGQHMKRVTMELGGHAPVIVCEDADIALAIKIRRRPSSATPARCASRRRASWCRRAGATSSSPALRSTPTNLKVGDGLAEGTQMGPLANPRRLARCTQFTADAVKRAAPRWRPAASASAAAATSSRPRC